MAALLTNADRNTARMLSAAVECLSDIGWSGLSYHRVSQVMGASETPIRNRVASIQGLAALTWTDRLAAPLIAALDRAASALAGAGADDDRFARALLRLACPTPINNATAELLVLSSFDPTVRGAIDATLGARLRTDLASGDADAARSAYIAALALGLLLANRNPDTQETDLDEPLRTRARALASDSPSTALPDVDAAHMDEAPDLAPDDPALHQLLTSCLTLVSMYGFDGVNVRDIARHAGFTEGLVYSRYPSKKAMFLDALKRQNQAGWELNHAFVTALERDHGPAVAEAVQWQQFQRPARSLGRAMALEQLRLTWHDESLRQAAAQERAAFRASLLERPGWADYETEGDFILNVAIPYGLYVLPLFVPDADRLPYDVVTVPLHEAFESQKATGGPAGAR